MLFIFDRRKVFITINKEVVRLVTFNKWEIIYFFNTSFESIHWKCAAYAENKQIPTRARVPQQWLNQSTDSIFPRLWAQGLAHLLNILCIA